MTACRRAMFCYNNFLDSTLTYSSQTSGYPASNVYNAVRSRTWKPSGLFEMTSANNTVYVNSTNFEVPVGTYTFATLATAFGTASGGLSLTLSRNSTSGIVTISSASSFTLNLSSTTDAIWNSLGFLSSTDISGPSLSGNEARWNNGEWLKIDMGIPQVPDFACLIPVNGEAFGLLPGGAVYLQGNNVDLWVSPQESERMSVDYKGAFIAPEDLEPCRYWRILIQDYANNAIKVAQAYIGTAYIPVNTNISTGFARASRDLSIRSFSENGTMFVDRRPKNLFVSSLQMQYAKDDDRTDFEQLMYDLGNENPFYLVIDPAVAIADSLSDMTHYVTLDSDATFTHVINDYFSASLSVREVI